MLCPYIVFLSYFFLFGRRGDLALISHCSTLGLEVAHYEGDGAPEKCFLSDAKKDISFCDELIQFASQLKSAEFNASESNSGLGAKVSPHLC